MTAPTHFYLASQIRARFNTLRARFVHGLVHGKSEDFCGWGTECTV